MKAHTRNKQYGIGIIEVMIAATIFALGVVAVIQLQGVFFKNSSAAQARTVASAIAEEKIEDLRSFETYDETASNGDIFDFLMIGLNSGGICDSIDDDTCTIQLPSTNTVKTIAVGNTLYSRDWTVVDYYYNSSGTLTTPVPVSENVDLKEVIVTVTWTDVDGTDQSLSMGAVINSNSGDSGGLLASNTGGSGESPQVTYTPSTDPSVIPVQVGGQASRETLVPTSSIVSGYVQTTTNAYTYNSSHVLIRQEEFRTVACSCAFDGTSGAGTETYAASYPAWNTSDETFEDITGDKVSGKVKGCVDNNQNGNCDSNPDEYCEICCRDHHDISTIAQKYDPYRYASSPINDFDAVTGNHNHYNGITAVTSGVYQESCRLKRIDGYWRVFQDWHMVNYDVIPETDLNNASTESDYTTYVKAIIDQHLDENKVSGETLTTFPTQPSSIDHTVAANYVNVTAGDLATLSGRALFLDYVNATHLSEVKAKKAAGEDYLVDLPFYEVEVAKESSWTSSDPSIVEPGPNNSASNFIAADEVKAVASDPDAQTITGTIRKSNTALTTLNVSLDYAASTNADDTTLNDTLKVCVGCTGAGSGSCTTPWGTIVADTVSVTAYSSSSVTAPTTCASISETRTCSSGTLSGSYQYASCSAATTCNTTVTGKANDKNDTITVNDGTTTYNCGVANSKNYTCGTVTTAVGDTLTITSSGSVNSTVSVTACGTPTVNF